MDEIQMLKEIYAEGVKEGILEGVRLMEQRMILAAKNGTPIDVDGRAYFIQDDMEHLKEIFAEIERKQVVTSFPFDNIIGELYYRDGGNYLNSCVFDLFVQQKGCAEMHGLFCFFDARSVEEDDLKENPAKQQEFRFDCMIYAENSGVRIVIRQN